jgi:hypothetical protein
LSHISRDSVYDKLASGRFCGDHRLPQHVKYDLVGYEFAAVEIFLNGLAESGLPRDVITQQLTGRDVGYAEVCADKCALSPLARARGRDHQYSHAHLLTSPPVTRLLWSPADPSAQACPSAGIGS